MEGAAGCLPLRFAAWVLVQVLMLMLMLVVGCIGCETKEEPSGMMAGWRAGRCLRGSDRIICGCGGAGETNVLGLPE